MSVLAELGPFVLLALIGGPHCAAMCGGFALAVSSTSSRPRTIAVRQATYTLGKASSYATLGVLVSTGSRWEASGELVRHSGVVAAWVAGAVLIAMGLAQLGVVRVSFAGALHRVRALAVFRATFARVRSLPGLAGALGTGVVNGFVPCGLSFAAVALCAGTSPTVAALGTFAFGIATGPALALVGWSPRLLPAPVRARLPYLVGVLLLAFGALTLWRGHPIAATCCEP